MRIVLLNPHVDDFFAEPLHFRLLRRRALKKYGFVIDGLLREEGKSWVYLDYRVSGFVPVKLFEKLPFFLRKFFCNLEFRAWLKANDLSEKVCVLSTDEIAFEDVLFGFSYKSARGRLIEPDAGMKRFKAVVFHLSHYFTYTAEKAKYLSHISNLWLAGDSDIKTNPYFQEHFSWYRREILVMPFAVARRFEQKMLPRLEKCVATGSFHDLSKEVPRDACQDFISFTGLTTYHPIRASIYTRKDEARVGDWLVSLVQPYRDYTGSGKWTRRIKHLFAAQKKYFAIDMVDVYNRHRFATVGEELSGFPALGAFEAMACGAVLIAYTPAYKGLGLESGRHYLAYDGSLDGLLSLLENTASLPLAAIAEAGQKLASEEFSGKSVFGKWLDALQFAAVNSIGAHEARDAL